MDKKVFTLIKIDPVRGISEQQYLDVCEQLGEVPDLESFRKEAKKHGRVPEPLAEGPPDEKG